MSSYTVNLVKDFQFPQRVRSGITVTKEAGYTGELTSDQLEAMQADQYLVVTEPKAPVKAEVTVVVAKAKAPGIVAKAKK